MTIIATFQGDNCALVASDLMFRTPTAKYQSTLPLELRTLDTFVSVKFRKRDEGDYIAFGGSIGPIEGILLHELPLDYLLEIPVKEHPWIRKEDQYWMKEEDTNWKRSNELNFSIYYAAIAEAQLYTGKCDEPLVVAKKGQAYIYGLPEEINVLEDITQNLCSGISQYNVNFLKELSNHYEKYLIEAEKSADNIGGYHSHIITPGEILTYRKNLGKLIGLPEIEIDFTGRLQQVSSTKPR